MTAPSTSTTFYFVRHGETEYNRRGIVQGRGIDADLNATGEQQAQAVARRFADVSLDAIYSSTLARAMQTADTIAVHHEGMPVHRLAALDEMAWGIYEGARPDAAIRNDLDAIYTRWRSGTFDVPIQGGESIYDVQQRGVEAIEHIVAAHGGETVLVVTHGRFLRVLLASLLEEYGLERMHEIRHANTAVNVLTHQQGRFAGHTLNCTAHLDTLHEAA